jgi:hypothetical protein
MSRKKKESRKIPSLNVYPIEGVTSKVLLESEYIVDFVYAETIIAIKEAYSAKKSSATLFQINGQDAFVEIVKADWKPALDKCITYFSGKEKYELCSELQTLKSKIKVPKTELV